MREPPIERLPGLVRRFGPVATREQLRSVGVGGRMLTRAVHGGILIRLRRAHYATSDISLDCATVIRLGGRLGSLSAARTYGWWVGLDTRIHVSWPAQGNVARPGREQFATSSDLVHHWRILRHPSDGDREVWRETPEQTLAQVLLSCDRLTAIACADSALRVGTLTGFGVATVFAAMPGSIARWDRYVDGLTDSGLESIVRVWLIDRGVGFRHHARVPEVGEVDFLVGTSLIIETDGRLGHEDAAGSARDYRRDTAAAIQGYVTARFNYAQVMFHWGTCEAQIVEHLSRRDHRRRID